jgi:kynureninase
MIANMDRSVAVTLDDTDPLQGFKSRFFIDDDTVCYLDGNSLGRLPNKTIEAVNNLVVNEWGKKIVGGWADWIDEAESVGDLIGRSALGASAGQTLAIDTNTINLYQLAWAAVKANPNRKKILIDRANFPSDRYAMEGIAKELGMDLVFIENEDSTLSESEIISPELLKRYLDSDVALVTLQIIQYRSGGFNDYPEIERLVRENGSLMLWDCSHALGSVNLQFDKNKIGLAVGCTYKYGNSGPGAPGWLYVSSELQAKLDVPIRGWFGVKNQFAMGPVFEKSENIRGFQISTPPIIGLRSVKIGFEMIEEATMELIQEKCLKGTEFMISLFDHWLAPLGFTLITPRDKNKRCGHIIITHPDGAQIAVALRQLKNVFPDYREPNGIRFSFSALPTSYTEIYDGFLRLKELVESGEYQSITTKSLKVT